jgi:hypothetical protein
MMIKRSPDRIPLHLIWIIGLLEMITVPLVAWIPQAFPVSVKSPLEGIIVGFLGIVILFLFLNRIIGRFNLRMNDHSVTGISILPSAFWNMFFLALIFGLQKMVGLIHWNSWILQTMVAGFVSVSGAVMIIAFSYRGMYNFFIPARISIKAGDSDYPIRSMSVFMVAALAGGYEAIALPVILIWQQAESNVACVAAITGLAGGIIGSAVVIFLYNHLKLPRLFFVFENPD